MKSRTLSVTFLILVLVYATVSQREVYPTSEVRSSSNIFRWRQHELTATIVPLQATTSGDLSITLDSTLSNSFANCICDLTYNHCDVYCCCDPDCNSGDRKKNQELFNYFCLPEGPAPSVITQCPVSSDVSQVSVVILDVEQFMQGQLCVAVSNNPSLGSLYPDSASLTGNMKTEIANLLKAQEYSFEKDATRNVSFSNTADTYNASNPVRSIVTDLSASLQPRRSYFNLPEADMFGRCSDFAPIPFLVGTNQEQWSCVRGFASTAAKEAACNTTLNPLQYLGNTIRVATSPDVSKDTSVTPTITALTINGTAQTGSSFSVPTPSWDASTSSCINALDNVELRILWDQDKQTVTGVDVKLGVSVLTSGTMSSWRQTFNATFTEDSETKDVTIYKSGNPGYQVGRPIMAGYKKSGDVIAQIAGKGNGLAVPGPGTTGLCSTAHETVMFGEDMVTGCFLELSYADFASCSSLQSTVTAALKGSGMADESEFAYVATWGNSSRLTLSDWIEVSGWSSLSTDSTNPGPGVCNIVDALHYTFVYTGVGWTTNLQYKLLTAEVSFTSRTWEYKCTGMYCYDSTYRSSQKQRFEIKTTASFVYFQGDAEDIIASVPDILPRLPDDFFYPFYTFGINDFYSWLNYLNLTTVPAQGGFASQSSATTAGLTLS